MASLKPAYVSYNKQVKITSKENQVFVSCSLFIPKMNLTLMPY